MIGAMGRLRSLVAALVCAAALVAVAPAAAAPVDSYVALGDSFASGPITPLYEQPFGCLRSTNNYPHLVARRLGIKTFRDVSCAGASTHHMYDAHGVTPGPANPPQLTALATDTDLVTLTIGGNDIGFGGIAQDCASLDPATPKCTATYNAGGDQLSARIAATAPKVAAVLADIHARSPDARVLVVNYSAIFPQAPPYCWPFLTVADGDVQYLRAKQEELNAMLASAAAAGNAELIDVYAASRGHDACQLPLIRWVEPVVPFILAAPIHPNLQGDDAMAGLIAAAVAGG
jgi:lysophospholipase L1-like esterase